MQSVLYLVTVSTLMKLFMSWEIISPFVDNFNTAYVSLSFISIDYVPKRLFYYYLYIYMRWQQWCLTFDCDVTDGTLNDELLAVVALRSPHLLVAVLALGVELCDQMTHFLTIIIPTQTGELASSGVSSQIQVSH